LLLASVALLLSSGCSKREIPAGPHRLVRLGSEEHVAPGGDGNVVDLGVASAYDRASWLFWTRLQPSMSGSTIHARELTSDGLATETIVIDATRADLRRGEITGCAWRDRRLRVAWTGTAPADELRHPGAVLDVVDVLARDIDGSASGPIAGSASEPIDGSASGPIDGPANGPIDGPVFVVNDVTRGWQYEAALRCDRDGRGFVAWHSHCYNAGPPHRASKSFARPSCTEDMLPTIAVREVDWHAVKPKPAATVTDMRADTRWLPRIRIAEDDTVVVVRVPAAASDGAGAIEIDVHDFRGQRRAGFAIVASPDARPVIDCDQRERCLVVWLERAEVVAAAFSTKSTRPYVRVTVERYERDEQPVDPAVACDRSGVCLVAWVQQRITYGGDAVAILPIGVVGRVYDLRNAALGDRDQISTTGLELLESPKAVAVADGEFLIAWPGDRERPGLFAQRVRARTVTE